MNIALWIVASLTAAAFLMAGMMKISQGRRVEEKGMAWARHYSDSAIRAIGTAEVAGGLGLILPAVTGIATWLVPAAALGLVLVMIGAVSRHVRDGDGPRVFAPAMMLGILAVAVAVGRIWVAPF
ncbi:DoxX family protein [Demequina sp.]|uniref:DoxX family protein n=1 Tax=Demequina sp. TaxID=2050685 RepID=UPI0025B8B7D1|nr:DoxX family protein [Demequina sp.]